MPFNSAHINPYPGQFSQPSFNANPHFNGLGLNQKGGTKPMNQTGLMPPCGHGGSDINEKAFGEKFNSFQSWAKGKQT